MNHQPRQAIEQELSQSLASLTNELEPTWAKLANLGNLFNAPRELSLSLTRLISFNPTKPLTSIPNLKLGNADQEKLQTLQDLVEIITEKIKDIDTRIEKNPNDSSLWITLGHCYSLLNDFPNAYSAYSNVIRIDPYNHDPVFFYSIGSNRLHFKYYSEANTYFQKIINLNLPQSPDVRLRYAVLLRLRGDNSKSLKEFEKLLISSEQGDDNLPPNLHPDDIYFQIAYAYQIEGQIGRAKELYQKLLNRHPECLEILQQYCWFLSIQSDRDSLKEAEALIRKSGYNDPLLKFIMARIAMKKDDMNTAYDRYCECILFWSDSPLFWCGLGILYLRNEQNADAIVAFQRALFLKDDSVELWVNLGLIYEIMQNNEYAMKVYNSAESRCGNHPLITQRIKDIQSNRILDKATLRSLVNEIPDSKYFDQIPEAIAARFLGDSPMIPSSKIELDSSLDPLFNSVMTCHQSLF